MRNGGLNTQVWRGGSRRKNLEEWNEVDILNRVGGIIIISNRGIQPLATEPPHLACRAAHKSGNFWWRGSSGYLIWPALPSHTCTLFLYLISPCPFFSSSPLLDWGQTIAPFHPPPHGPGSSSFSTWGQPAPCISLHGWVVLAVPTLGARSDPQID